MRFRRLLEILFLLSFLIIGFLIIWGGVPFFGEARPAGETPLREARYWIKLGEGWVQCTLCFRNCSIPEGERGYCTVRVNRGGTLYTLVYGKIAAIQVDPVEKEPLFHFLPGTMSLCFGTAGCNFKCSFCHNWHLAVRTPEEVGGTLLSPEEAVSRALGLGVTSISFTYNEPTVFFEWVYDVAKLAQERGLKTYFHTNGAINPEPLRALLNHLDAVCVDLKAFTAEFYRGIAFAEMEPVLNTLKIIREKGVWLEIVNLIIPTLNDDMENIREMCLWIRDNLGKDVPLHFTRFFPAFRLTRLPPTPIETLEQARAIALEVGLEFVTIGNVPGHEANSTFCPECGETLIKRVHFSVLANHIEEGECKFCGRQIPGVWE